MQKIKLTMFVIVIITAILSSLAFKRADDLGKQAWTMHKVAEEKETQAVEYRTLEVKTTAYCPCKKCCGKHASGITATGTKATAGRTVAVDPNTIPLGSLIEIDGVVYIAEDTGGAIKGNKVDIFFNSHSEALRYGVQTKTAKIIREGY